MNLKMNNKKPNLNETNVKYVKSENISLVTNQQVRQFYADEDRDSYKVERSKLFQNNPSPQHHYRYLPESRVPRSKSKKSPFIRLKSKSKKLISYCLIYILMFVCAITLLYLFYTPKQMNLFGFYSNDNLRLKFYRFVLGTNGSTITPKIISTTEATIFITFSSSMNLSKDVTKTKLFSTTKLPVIKFTSTTKKPHTIKEFTAETNMIATPKTTKKSYLEDKPTDVREITTLSPVTDEQINFENEQKIDKISGSRTSELSKSIATHYTTCITESSTNKKLESSSTINPLQPTTSSSAKKTLSTTKSKNIEILKKGTTSVMFTEATTMLPKDNFTETIEFKEKIFYSNNQFISAEKNETGEDETIVDNGILPTEEEQEEKRKDEIESKQKIASFFGVDPKTGKEKDNKVINPFSIRESNFKSNSENNLLNRFDDSNQKQSNRWFLTSKQFSRDFSEQANKKPKEDEFKYNHMLKLLYKNCYGGC